MKRIFHAVYADETVTFLTEDARQEFLCKHPEVGCVQCHSDVFDAEYRALEIATTTALPPPDYEDFDRATRN